MPSPVSPSCHGYLPKVTQDAWTNFVANLPVGPAVLRAEIMASWERCLTLNVDPYGKSPSTNLVDEETLEQNRFMLRAAERHMDNMFELLRGQGYVIMLLSKDGFILRLFGDKKVVSMAESLNVFQGANNSEKSIGTFAPGVCIAEQKPVQVHLCEHFRQVYHNWCCSAAPLFNTKGELMGVLDITSVNRPEHSPVLLNLVLLTASAIEAETNYLAVDSERKKVYSYFTTVSDTSPDPIIIVDQHDKFAYLNTRAQSFLGISGEALMGQKASSVISNYPSVKNGVLAGRHLGKLLFFAPPKRKTADARLKMILSDAAEPLGIIGALTKEHEPENLEYGALYGFQDIVHGNSMMKTVINEAKQIARTPHTVLIQGESGTGKEVFAHAMHRYSQRSHSPFIALNCAALPKELIQSELFGYESGAFTGAAKNGRPGKFELAHGGALFLDEIGDMPLEAQASLLRVLEEKRITRIGASQPKPVDVHIIAATNKVLSEEVHAGRFRNDLFYRLSVVSLTIPPLRERQDDIWPLLECLVEKHQEFGVCFENITFDVKARTALLDYSWPGNVRELENTVISILMKMKSNTVTLDILPSAIANLKHPTGTPNLPDVERDAIRTVLGQCNGHVTQAAKILGISRATLYRKIQTYNLTVSRT